MPTACGITQKKAHLDRVRDLLAKVRPSKSQGETPAEPLPIDNRHLITVAVGDAL